MTQTPRLDAHLPRLLTRSHEHVLSQMLRYGMVSAVALVVDVGAMVFCVEVLGLVPVVAGTISFSLGIVVNILCTRAWVFSRRKVTRTRAEFGLFYLVGVVGLGLNAAIIAALHDGIGWHYLVAKFAATAVVFFWNFLARRRLIYG